MPDDAVDPTPRITESSDARERRYSMAKLLEIYFWLFASLSPLIKPLLLLTMEQAPPRPLLLDFIPNLFYSFFILGIPVIISMTFGTLPFAALRERFGYKRTFVRSEPVNEEALVKGRVYEPSPDPPDSYEPPLYSYVPEHTTFVPEHTTFGEGLTVTQVARGSVAGMLRNDPRHMLYHFAAQSTLLAQRVYNRAGVYLVVGVFIAIGGLGFFYIRSLNLPPEKDLVDRALSLLPGFGILFFIEFVALFFLRQHRAAMDDFRYYDAVRRHREENLVILTMFAENSTIVPTTDVIKAMTIYSGGQKLMQGETTEILEARRLQGDDLVVFEKLIEAFSALKGAAAEPKKLGLRESRKS